MPAPSVQIVREPHDVSHAALRRIVDAAEEAITERGVFTLGLSGGPVLQDLYTLMGQGVPWQPPVSPMQWGKTEFFFTDESCVPSDEPGSTFGMADTALLSRLPIRGDSIHRIRGEIDPEEAAKEYGLLLKHRFGAGGLDVIVLSLGDDGRVAGLFPRTPALLETHHRVVANPDPSTDTWHVTMTAPFINRARQVILLASGAQTAACLRDVLEGPHDPERLPVQRIAPSGSVTWIADAAAAGMLASPQFSPIAQTQG